MNDPDIDLAIALSLSEAEYKGQVNTSKQLQEEDKALALRIQQEEDKLSSSTKSNSHSHANTSKSLLIEDELLALSMQEEERSAIKINHTNLSNTNMMAMPKDDTTNDHDFAVKLQQQMNEEEQIQQHHKHSARQEPQYKHQPTSFTDPDCCATCGSKNFFTGGTLRVKGRKYHPNCFRCSSCEIPIKGQCFFNGDGQVYCIDCREVFALRCYLCDETLNGQIHRHPFFDSVALGGNTSIKRGYCPSHENTQKSCYSCQRKEPLASSSRSPFNPLGDGRIICHDCAGTIILDSHSARDIYLESVDFLQDFIGLQCPKEMREIPVLCVDANSMGENRKGAANDHHARATTVPRGVTLKTESRVRHFGHRVSNGYGLPFILPQSNFEQVSVHRTVTAVLVISGLPRDLCATVLTHEAFHVWCALTKDMPSRLPLKVEEGLSEYVAGRFVTWRMQREGDDLCSPINSNTSTNGNSKQTDTDANDNDNGWNRLLRRFIAHSLETNNDPIYGDGFREAARCCDTLGLEIVLEHIKNNSSFPLL